MSTGVEGSFQDVVGWSADADDGRAAEGGDGGDGVVHAVVADVAMFAVDDDSVEAGEGDDLGLSC